ncbi:MAG: YtxH domain-containing protein [Chloroflexi bacterium]|nr:YtxH domain-containing protein [Chloroflexota bacterium]
MDNRSQENGNNAKNVWGFLAGLLVGGLAGAGAMLLLAPQSGEKTRTQIQQKSIELRDQTVKTVEGAVAQARGKAHQITDDVREQAGALQQRGQDVIDEQRDNLSQTLKGWGKAVQA